MLSKIIYKIAELLNENIRICLISSFKASSVLVEQLS